VSSSLHSSVLPLDILVAALCCKLLVCELTNRRVVRQCEAGTDCEAARQAQHAGESVAR
jgi:hypothetical protein